MIRGMHGETHAPTGVVLAGGQGLRLGREKGTLMLGGRTLAARAAETLAPLCCATVVSVAAGAPNPAPGHPVVHDPAPAGRGPLVGIDAAFRRVPGGDLLVLACDYPRVNGALLRGLLGKATARHDVVLPRDSAGRLHPLVGLWRRAMAAHVRDAIARNRFAVHAVVEAVSVGRFESRDLPAENLDELLLNVNAPADLALLRLDESD